MNFNPVREVGEALKTAIAKGLITETEEIRNTLEFIEKEGLWQWETHYDR